MVYGIGIMNSAFWINIGVLAAWGLGSFLIGSKLFSWKADDR
jgi:hypothetical protein